MEMKIEYKAVDELIEYENNPRLNDNAVEPVAKSIKEFGFTNPVLVDNENVIIAGHTRLRAAVSLGMKEVPCIVCSDLSTEQANALRLVDNKVGEKSNWDLAKLNEELAELDMDMEQFGFYDYPNVELDDLFAESAGVVKEEKEPERIQCPYCGEWFEKL